MNNLVIAGMLLLFVGAILVIIGLSAGGRGETKVAVGGFIGPVPFGFANDPRLLILVIGISAVILSFFILTRLRLI